MEEFSKQQGRRYFTRVHVVRKLSPNFEGRIQYHRGPHTVRGSQVRKQSKRSSERSSSQLPSSHTKRLRQSIKIKPQISFSMEDLSEHQSGPSKEFSEKTCKEEYIKSDIISMKEEEFSPHQPLANIKKVWNLLIVKTGVKFGIIPPHLLKDREVEHWLHLNIEDLPVQYLYSDGTVVNGDNGNRNASQDIESITFTAALLFNEYVQLVLKDLQKQQADDKIATLIKLLEDMILTLQGPIGVLKETVMVRNGSKNILTSPMNNFATIIMQIENMLSSITFDNLGLVIEKGTVTMTETDLLLNILGLDPVISDRMIDIDDEMVLHQSPLYFVLNSIGNEFNTKETGAPFEDQLQRDLHKIGFSLERSKKIVDSIDSDFHDMQSPMYWAEAYLEDVFSSQPLLTTLPRHDSTAVEMNEWHSQTLSHEVTTVRRTVKYEEIIVVFEDEPKVAAASIKTKFHLDGHRLLYHGTNQADEVLKGIDFVKSSSQQDFSNNNGFYLHESFEAAKLWAKVKAKGFSPIYSVIVYRVPEQLLTSGCLDLSDNDDLWLRVIKYYRSGCTVVTDVPEEVRPLRYKYIKGPICKNGYKYQKAGPNVAPIKYEHNGNIVQQYCIRDAKLAGQFSFLPVGVIKIKR